MSQITGREPRLSRAYAERGARRLLPRRFASLLNKINPNNVSLPAVAAALESDEFFVRYNAGKLLARRADRDARFLCEDVLRTGSVQARASVARHLYGFSWFVSEALYRTAFADSDARVREAAVYALCDLRGLNAYKMLTEMLPGQPDNVLEAAAVGLRDCPDEAVVPALEPILSAQDSDVRVKGLEALSATDSHAALHIVWRVIQTDPSGTVRYAAALSLLELGRETVLTSMARLIAHETGIMRLYIVQGFFHAVNYLHLDTSAQADAIFEALSLALKDPMPEARIAAVWPLAWLRHPRSTTRLQTAFTDEVDTQVKIELLRITVKLMTDAGEALLPIALHDAVDAVREAALRLQDHRQAVGRVLTYDETLDDGFSMAHPQLGR